MYFSNIFSSSEFFPCPSGSYVDSCLNQTWFKVSAQKALVQGICNIQSKATDCKECADYCESHVSSDKIPPKMLDFWLAESRTTEETHNAPFMSTFEEVLEDHMKEEELHAQTEDGGENVWKKPDSKWEKKQSLLNKGNDEWTMAHKELGNTGKVENYFPFIEDFADSCFHSLTTPMGFDMDEFTENKTFGLRPSTQMPANNRDVEKAYIQNSVDQANGGHNMFECLTNQPGTEEDEETRYRSTDGHFILVKRLRREDVDDEDLRGRLSSHTHMSNIQSTETNKKTRWNGVKIVGDHVGVGCDCKEASDLFEVLTASTSSLFPWIFECPLFEYLIFELNIRFEGQESGRSPQFGGSG